MESVAFGSKLILDTMDKHGCSPDTIVIAGELCNCCNAILATVSSSRSTLDLTQAESPSLDKVVLRARSCGFRFMRTSATGRLS